MSPSSQQPLTAFQCRMIRKIYDKKDSGFAIIVAEPGVGSVIPTTEGFRPLNCVIKGNFSSVFEHLSQGLELKCYGRWGIHEGKPQFDAKFVMEAMPTTMASLEKLLASGKFKGIGPVIARRIVSRFGADAMQILSQSPERLAEIEGVSVEGAKAAGDSWKAWKGANGIVDFLREHGVGEAIGERIWKSLGDRALDVIRKTPYELTKIPFVGFGTADKIAMAEGVSKNSPFRIAAAVKHVLDETLKNDGDFAIKELQALRKAQLLMDDDVSRAEIQHVINEGVSRGKIIVKEIDVGDGKGLQRFLSMQQMLNIEQEMAKDMHRVYASPSSVVVPPSSKHSETLDDSQKFALMSAVSSKLSIVTGGPGTGKTYTLNSILSTIKDAEPKAKIKLCAPTGKAANRMEKSTGHTSGTIHRVLECVGTTFKRNRENKLDVDFLGIDEGSMIDSYTGLALLRAIPDHASVLLIGDVDQLKPVGPGAFFSDVIASGCFPVARLNEGHRQEEGSGIVKAAHRILAQKMPELKKWDDFVFIDSEDEQNSQNVISVVKSLLSSGVDPNAIQILSPQHEGFSGTNMLNSALKPILNPAFSDQDLLSGLGEKFKFSIGDRVIQGRNNYDVDVFNGEIGFVKEIDTSAASLWLDFDGRMVEFGAGDMGDLKLSFAMTVHKSQGSEFDYVVIPVTRSSSFMLTANLLYTAITRAKKQVFLVGDEDVIRRSVLNKDNKVRMTFLAEEIRKELSRRASLSLR